MLLKDIILLKNKIPYIPQGRIWNKVDTSCYPLFTQKVHIFPVYVFTRNVTDTDKKGQKFRLYIFINIY